MQRRTANTVPTGGIKKEYYLSEPFTRETAGKLSSFGTVTLLAFLPKPLFTLVRKPNMNMRAVLGERIVEIWYKAKFTGSGR